MAQTVQDAPRISPLFARHDPAIVNKSPRQLFKVLEIARQAGFPIAVIGEGRVRVNSSHKVCLSACFAIWSILVGFIELIGADFAESAMSKRKEMPHAN